jgi:hypothetical protein
MAAADDTPNLKGALAQFIQEHMPWPFSDVSRYDDEGNDAAWDIAERLLPRVEAEFADITRSAKQSRRTRQFVESERT